MSEKGELDLTGVKLNTGVWLVKKIDKNGTEGIGKRICLNNRECLMNVDGIKQFKQSNTLVKEYSVYRGHKVPKYLSQQWAKATGRGEVGKIKIAKNQGKTEVSFTLSEELACIQNASGKGAPISAPREHPFTMQSVGGQTLSVFTEGPSGQSEDKSDGGNEKLTFEGVVVQRAECRPAVNESYMRLKRQQIEESSKPFRLSLQLDKAVTTNYKPVANHQYNIEYERKKKEDGKRARADKHQVLDMLFSAFEKHQYYNIKDLVDITKQPVTYLKEILREIGIYNVKGTHKNTWELKPEYRHYQNEDKSE